MLDIRKKMKSANFIEKKWGGELIIANNDEYCGKILKFNKGAEFSTHFHIKKHETWYVYKGMLQLTLIDTTTADKYITIIKEGNVIEIERFLPHKLKALENSEIFEISTTHYDNDSYRIEKGDSQNK